MGNAQRKQKKKEQLRQDAITQEKHRKEKHKIVLVIGDMNCGKHTIIQQILSLYINNSIDKIESKYKLGHSFIVHETVYTGNIQHSSKSYNHLDIVYRNLNVPTNTHSYYGSLIRDDSPDPKPPEMDFTKIAKDKHWMKHELLIFGYVHIVFGYKVPIDIINVINRYHKTSYIDSHIAEISNVVFEFWRLSVNDERNWKQLYNYSSAIIFVCDINGYNEYNDKRINSLHSSLLLFENVCESINELQHYPEIILYLNKYDLFSTKIKTIPLNECKQWKDYQNEDDEVRDGVGDALKYVRDKFKPLVKNTKHTLYIHVTNALDKDHMAKVFWDTHHCITMANMKLS